MDGYNNNSNPPDYQMIFQNISAEDIRYDDLNDSIQSYIRFSTSTVVYMSICLSCTIWQVLTAFELVYRARKWLHYAVLFQTILSLTAILTSVLNPLTELSCDFRFWVSIIAVELGGCVIQTVLLYKAYICYDRSKWLLILGSLINLGYIALTFVYGTLGKVPYYKDILGNCVMENLEWPALAKLGLDIASNAFLSVAFLMVIRRHYKMFGNSLHKSLFSSGIIFSVGVIISNLVTAILISCRAMGGLSSYLYSFDWVITSYLLIMQFKKNKSSQQNIEDEEYVLEDEEYALGNDGGDEEKGEQQAEQDNVKSLSSSFAITTANTDIKPIASMEHLESHLGKTLVSHSNNYCGSSGMSATTKVHHQSFDSALKSPILDEKQPYTK